MGTVWGETYGRIGFAVLAVFAAFYACYRAWSREHAEVRKLLNAKQSLQLFLAYEPTTCANIFSGFYLGNQSERIAFAVEIDSDRKLHSRDRTTMVLLWDPPLVPIENGQRYQLRVMAAEQRNGRNYPVGGLGSEQINSFFERIGTGRDVLVTVRCSDVDGHPCSPRVFRVSATDFGDIEQIRCEPLADKPH